MTEQISLTVKENAIKALDEARETLHVGQYGSYTEDQVFELAAKISGLAPYMLKWAQDE